MQRIAACSVALLAIATVSPRAARAHGRPASLGRIVEDPLRPGHLMARATWGLARSDGGGPWSWGCAASYGVDARSEDPALLYARGALVLGTFDGLLRSTDEGCSWTRPSPLLEDLYVVDVVAVDPDHLLALGARTGEADRLYESRDAGATWAALPSAFGEVVVGGLLAVDGRVYAGGTIPGDGTARVPMFLRSDDGGVSFEARALMAEEGERGLVVWATAPDDPEVLYGQMLHFNGEDVPERIVRSADGGASWETVLRIPFVGGLVATEEGVFVGSRLGGLFRATDGVEFESIDDDLAVTCLAALRGGLHVCVDEARSGFAIGRWDGAGVSAVTRLAEIDTPMPCAQCSDVGAVCPAWAGDIIVDLGLDAPLPSDFDPDASTGAPRDASPPDACRDDPVTGCGCRVAGVGGTPAPWLWLLASLVLGRRRARHR